MKRYSIVIVIILFLILPAYAHPGRTDSYGCHTCRTNCASWGLSTGEYHCHRAKSTAPQPKEPIKSHKSETGTGYTTPAPDYKTPIQEQNKNNDINATKIPPVSSTTQEINKTLTTSNEITPPTPSPQKEDSKNSSIPFWLILGGGGGYLISKARKKKKN